MPKNPIITGTKTKNVLQNNVVIAQRDFKESLCHYELLSYCLSLIIVYFARCIILILKEFYFFSFQVVDHDLHKYDFVNSLSSMLKLCKDVYSAIANLDYNTLFIFATILS
jgi:hypothetical protein